MVDWWQAVSEVGPERPNNRKSINQNSTKGLKTNEEITGKSKCDVLITCCECFLVDFSPMEVIFRMDFHFK